MAATMLESFLLQSNVVFFYQFRRTPTTEVLTTKWEPSLALLSVIMASSNGSIFRIPGPLCGEFTGNGEFPAQRPVTRSFHVFFDLRLNKWMSKQSRGWWFEMPSHSLWRHCNVSLTRQAPFTLHARSEPIWTKVTNTVFVLRLQGSWE